MVDLSTLIFVFKNWNYFFPFITNIFECFNRSIAMIMMSFYWKVLELAVIFYGHCCIIMAACGSLSAFVFRINIWQTKQLLSSINYSKHERQMIKKIQRKLIQFQHFNTKNLRFLQSTRIYFEGFVVFLIIHIPLNCYLIILIMNGNENGFVIFFITAFAAQQIICILCIHLFAAICNKEFHSSSNRFMNLLVRSHRYWHRRRLSTLLKLSHYGQAYHTKKNMVSHMAI